MKKYLFRTFFVLLLIPIGVHAAPLTQAQSLSLINVVRSSPGTPASVFTNLIITFSNITVNQAESLIGVVQASPDAPSEPYVNMLVAFTEEAPEVSTGTIQQTTESEVGSSKQEAPQSVSTKDPSPAQPIDASVPKIWEAQFGEQIRTHIPELSTWAPKMIRLVTNEPINLTETKFQFRSPLGIKTIEVTLNIVSENVARSSTDTCYVNCDLGGYYSTFFLDEPLTAKIPQGASVPSSYDFEFLVVDYANNYSTQWHSARDIAEFIYE